MQSSFFWDIIKKYENVLNCEGRIYARASGTEPLIRILIEGKNLKDVEFVANGLDCDIKKFKKLVWKKCLICYNIARGKNAIHNKKLV